MKSPRIIMNFPIPPFSFISFSFTYLAALLFGTYTFIIAMSSWWIDPFVFMYHHLFLCHISFCLVIFFALKSDLSDNIDTSVFFSLGFVKLIFSICLLSTFLYCYILSAFLVDDTWLVLWNECLCPPKIHMLKS